ncbi:hypothetical protein TWF481_006486 [Arthrobotrys musiformis]|uniref:Uncharacterized protein n=1 Tax=Arthrobotrys musiformis TaxID=47236 RepID=A0AAV9W9K6_9PEZI
MSGRKDLRLKRDDSPRLQQPTFLLPSPSEDSIPSLWEVDSDIDQDRPSEISLRPVRQKSTFVRDANKDGENSPNTSRSARRPPPELSLVSTESDEADSLSRIHTAERELDRKKSKNCFRIGKPKDDKDRDQGCDRETKKKKREKKEKPPLGQKLRHKLSLRPHRNQTKDIKNSRSKHGFSISTDPVNIYKEPIESDSGGRVRKSQHMTAEVKLHFWRDKYEGEGRIERFLKLMHKKRFRKFLKTAIDLQAASLGSLRSHSRRSRDYD